RRRRSRKVGSSPRRARSICPTWRWPTPRTASRHASVSSSSARGKTAKRCASPSVLESRSMADTQQNTEPKKPKKPKVAKDSDAPKVKKPRERSDYVARLKTHFAQVDRHLQAARRPGHRLQSDTAQGAHVRLHRPAGKYRAAAYPRLPRAQSEELRRPRQLQPRHQGTHRVPGDRFRQDYRLLGHGHHRLHKRTQRR